MQNVLIIYYPLGEVSKVAQRMKNIFEKEKLIVDTEEITLKKEMTLNAQFKKEKKLELTNKIKSFSKYDLIVIGTPIISFTSVPAVNAFIRSMEHIENKNFILYATSIGLPGKGIKKMTSLLSMKKATVVAFKVFSSIFEFNEKKLKEVDLFVESIKLEKLS